MTAEFRNDLEFFVSTEAITDVVVEDFLISRFSRLYPAYWVCVIITSMVVNFSPYYHYHPVALPQFISNLTMFQHWMSVEDVDGVYWTMAVELCFYLFIYAVFISRQQKNIERIGVAWLVTMTAVYFLVPRHALHYCYYYIPLLRSGDLFLGGILFYQLKKNTTQKRKYILLLLTLFTHFIINSLEESLVIAFIYIIMFLFVTDRLKVLKNNILFFFGVISYPLYLLHQYIGYAIINFLNACKVESTFLKTSITAVLLILLASIITFLVEKPAMKFIRRNFSSVSRPEEN